MQPLVSVIITNFNYGHFIADAIRSVNNQDYPNIEIIVVDDGSTDNSIDVISKYLNSVKLITKINGGVSSARNYGVAVSKGDLIAFLDADDLWSEDKISKQVSKLINSGDELVYCKMKITDFKTTSKFSSEDRHGNFKNHFIENPGKTPFPPSSVLLSRDLSKKVGRWNEDLRNAAEDFDYFRRCSNYSSFGVVDEYLLIHREHYESLTAGSVHRYFKYNVMAMMFMYNDDNFQVSNLRKNTYIAKFCWSFTKTFLRSGSFRKAAKVLISAILPRTFLESIAEN